jgi:SAM-dependent methyltransferase
MEQSGALIAPRFDPGRQRLSEWFREPAGQRVTLGEQQLIARHLSNLFGYNLLQVGVLPGVDLLATSRVLHRSVMDLGGGDPVPPCDSVVRGSAGCLPIESDCMDVVVLPHVVEFEPSPHEALREAARVLIPEGHLLLTSFSPRSLLGLWRFAARHRREAPWSGHFFTSSRLRDWLELLGFDLLDVAPLMFEPPVRVPRALEPLKRMEPAMRRLCPLFAGCHVMLARKRIATVTPIRPRFAYRRRLVGVSLAGPPARVVNRAGLRERD